MLSALNQQLLRVPWAVCWRNQPSRTAVVVRRLFPPPLYKLNQTGPFRPKLKQQEFIYAVEEDTGTTPAGNIDVILATDVEGFGLKGDIVNVSKRIARNHMLPVGVAEYVTPQSLAKYDKVRQERKKEVRQSLTAYQTLKQLNAMTLPIPMSPSTAWTLTATHVKVALRLCGVVLNENCITLPKDPVTAPGSITVYVTVNGLHRVPVRSLVYHYSKTAIPDLPPVWSTSPDAKFNVFEVISAAAHQMRGLTVSKRDDITEVTKEKDSSDEVKLSDSTSANDLQTNSN